MQQKITPNLWFNKNAKEAVDYYTAIFPNGATLATSYYPNSQAEGLADFQLDMAGKELSIEFRLGDLQFTAINAGPEFKPNPSISFMVNFDPSRDKNALENLNALWGKLVDGGKVLMSLDKYSYSDWYGWVQDRYGVSWQLILTNPAGESRPFIIPSLLFTQQNTNRAKEAIKFYISVFENTKIGMLTLYEEATGPAKADAVMFADFTLEGQWFAAMDSGADQDFTFNEGISLSVACKSQEEIDYLWNKLSTVPEAEQCGWCKDQFGVSWQIVPEHIEELMQRPNAYSKLMNMKKLVIDEF